MLRFSSVFLLISLLFSTVAAKTHTFVYNATWTLANPDGTKERPVISFNGSWPLPVININKGDSIELTLINGLGGDATTSLHFHGLFQEGSNHMDGPVGVTQCPIPPGQSFTYNFTVNQVGTYWYHSHSGSQYSDGLRGMLIVHDEEVESNYEWDHEIPLTLSDWYHAPSSELVKMQLTRYNPTGAEPIPQNSLFNDTKNVTVEVDYEKTYLFRIVNMGVMVSQYFFVEDHDLTVIEVDGVYTQPKKTSMVYLSVGQRMSVLLTTKAKKDVNKNFCIVQSFDDSMLDVIPPELQVTSINYLSYDKSFPKPEPSKKFYDIDSYEPLDDFELKPISNKTALADPDHRIEVALHMDNLGDGVNYAFFNNHTYVAPKVPTLLSVLSAPKDLVSNQIIYGSNTNTYVLQSGDTIEIVINNEDDNKHPFHLHGHQFQIIARSDAYDEPHHYNPDKADEIPEIPSMRDTVIVEGNGYVVLRFVADNPGVWFFHCHLDFHLEQGLAITLVEAPDVLQSQLSRGSLPADFLSSCKGSHMPVEGNAAGNHHDWLDLVGENLQPLPLPEGFTLKGYVAIIGCTVIALIGLKSIYNYGMDDVKVGGTGLEDEKLVIKKLLIDLVNEEQSGKIKNAAKKLEIRKMIDELSELDKKYATL
ncbi:unnamed protein product [Ambrosiozyma monospora]|uniref:Unnamed protein product n=1 Tax=Ambrosiozyma monospora TaxID=43982 RepID=A0A9W6Z359_AMBMO|nr:unnamed protein product [Ambrosiozyma monospora]